MADEAKPLDESSVSENQEKTIDYYFGVFIDLREIDSWFNTVGKYRNKGKKMKEDFESDVMDTKYGKVAAIVDGTAKNVADKLPPNNPVSKAIQAKDKVMGYKDKAEGMLGKVEGFVDNAANKVLDNDFIKMEGIDPLGSKRSIISMMEPAYWGKPNEDDVWGTYYSRIYLQGSVHTGDFKPKKSSSEEDESEDEKSIEEARGQWIDEAVQEALDAIKQEMSKIPQGKVCLHFDLFGYSKDPSIDKLKPKLDGLKQESANINEIKIDYTGKYENLNDPDEVSKSLSGGEFHFRNNKFLEKNG